MTTSRSSLRRGNRSLTRRRFMAVAGGTAALAAAPIFELDAQQRPRIVFATWGGSWEQAMRKAWFDPFTAKTGIEVVTASGNEYGKIRAMVQAGQTQWDVVEVNPDFQWIGARENLLEKLDFAVIKREAIMPGEELVSDVSVPQVLWSRVMFYNTKRFPTGQHPKNWAEAWDTAKFPGKRALASKANGGGLEIALLADGVAPDKLFPLDVDRALRSLSRIKNDILWYDTNAQGEQYMLDGQAVLGFVPDGRALSAKTRGAPVEIEYNQSLMTWSTMVMPRGAPNRAGAMQFLAYALTPEAQAAIATAFTYGPVVPKAFEMLPAERAAILSGGPQQAGKYILANERWWGENLGPATEKLNTWRLS